MHQGRQLKITRPRQEILPTLVSRVPPPLRLWRGTLHSTPFAEVAIPETKWTNWSSHPYASLLHGRFLEICSSPFMGLAEHLTALRARCMQCLAGWWKPDVLRPGILWMRGSMVIRLRPCKNIEDTPPPPEKKKKTEMQPQSGPRGSLPHVLTRNNGTYSCLVTSAVVLVQTLTIYYFRSRARCHRLFTPLRMIVLLYWYRLYSYILPDLVPAATDLTTAFTPLSRKTWVKKKKTPFRYAKQEKKKKLCRFAPSFLPHHHRRGYQQHIPLCKTISNTSVVSPIHSRVRPLCSIFAKLRVLYAGRSCFTHALLFEHVHDARGCSQGGAWTTNHSQ